MRLDLLPLAVDNAQIGLIQHAGTQKNLVDKAHLFFSAELLDRIFQKIFQNRRCFRTYSQQHIVHQDQTERYGRIRFPLMTVFHRRNVE